MELAAHWHRCQILQKTSEYFHQHSTQREASLSSEAVSRDCSKGGSNLLYSCFKGFELFFLLAILFTELVQVFA